MTQTHPPMNKSWEKNLKDEPNRDVSAPWAGIPISINELKITKNWQGIFPLGLYLPLRLTHSHPSMHQTF